jgi:sec-independent protein translocase protein TatA
MDALSPWHLLIIAAVFVVLFGSRRLPDAARSVGRSLRILRTELREQDDDGDPPTSLPR